MMDRREPAMPAETDSSTRGLAVEIEPGDTPWTALGALDLEAAVGEVAAAITRHARLPAARTSATLALGTDAEVRALNSTWRAQDKPTNVLSFPSAPMPASHGTGQHSQQHFLGDVIIAEETLAREAAEQGIPPADHFRHLVLHGLLHLLGYDHEDKAEADEMETLETRILVSIGVPDPYAGTEAIDAAPSPSRTKSRK